MADLVLLDANPLDDIRNTKRIAAVILRGKLYDKGGLERILAAVRGLRIAEWMIGDERRLHEIVIEAADAFEGSILVRAT